MKKDILKNLIAGMDKSPCPKKIDFANPDEWNAYAIEISSDETAYVYMHRDAEAALNER